MDVQRWFEKASIFAFLLLAALLFRASALSSSYVPAAGQAPSLHAFAYTMPNQGWAPLTVYLSPYGSAAEDGSPLRYEWDLDNNGFYETDATQSGGYLSHSFIMPGEYPVHLRITDGNGNTAIASTLVTVRHPNSSSVDYWTIFDDTRVRRADLLLTQTEWDQMWANPEAKATARADAIIFGERLDEIGLRMRGQFSLRESGDKKPWKIDTDFFVDGQEYHNLKQLVFINNVGDPSMLREKLAYDMLAFAGAPASHVCFVELWFDVTDDDEPPIFWGVYTMVERVDRKYVFNRFGSSDGNLYKASHAQRGPLDLVYYGENLTDYPTQNGLYSFEKVTDEEEADYSDIIGLMRVIDGVAYETPEDFAQALEPVFDVDTFLRYMAAVITLSNWDIYPYTGNNFYLYHDPETDRFEWIPWDLAWGEDVRTPLFELAEFRLSPQAPLYENVFAVERYRQAYAAYLDLLNRTWFTYDNIYQRSSYFHELIAPYVTQGTGDKMFFGGARRFSIENFDESWTSLAEFARQRQEFILESLAQGGQ
jgi:spore coat protein H